MLAGVFADAGLDARVPRVGTLLGLSFSEAPVTDYDQARASAETGTYRRFFRAMLDRGVALAPGPYEVLFPSLAHGRDDIERTADLAASAAREVVERRPSVTG
jgi:glutamate-1-semialdehyde 2,1-aminomutase